MADIMSITECPKLVGLKRSRSDDEKTASSSSSSNSSSSSDSSWKTMYEDEHTKNTMLNLQLCFVQSECMRLLNLQSDMASSISTLQVSLAYRLHLRYHWINSQVITCNYFSITTKRHLLQHFSLLVELSCELDRRCRKR